jgi:hypothetical protein
MHHELGRVPQTWLSNQAGKTNQGNLPSWPCWMVRDSTLSYNKYYSVCLNYSDFLKEAGEREGKGREGKGRERKGRHVSRVLSSD